MEIGKAPSINDTGSPLQELGLQDEAQGIEAEVAKPESVETPGPDMPTDSSGLGLMDRPIPGQSLTNNPDAPYSFEKPPAFTDVNMAMSNMFGTVTDPEKITQTLELFAMEVPIEDITSVYLFEMFRTGLINPDLNLLMIEPTMLMLMFLADYSDIDVVIGDLDHLGEDKTEVLEETGEDIVEDITEEDTTNLPELVDVLKGAK